MYVSPPTVEPYGYGLFSVAQFPVETDRHWRCGVEWEPYACDPARTIADDCHLPPVEKVLDDGVPLVSASAFTVYGSYLCRTVGRTEQQILDRVRQAVRLGEQRAVEHAFWTGELGNTPRLADPGAVILNPGGVIPADAGDALSPVAGLAALESYLRESYGGTGVIHAPAGAVPVLAQAQQFCGTCTAPLRTWLGTPVAAGGGYVVNTGPDGNPAPAGTAWLYGTGPVAIRRGEVFINPDSIGQALNRTTNEVAILAEREYVVGFDCLLAAVLISINC
ncbi:hypothetical protein JOL79_06865 [Microbispora sp. RL4-1S]|uniref:Uncharacterized protein n=1 Tax=Microbispora oryzae TaxID=2806554 RepID=A0A940WDF9_9ACTN|nr:hypothetical protein [Microbispora oryzae]MBP2703519.1 hypothetical protein [Microbispora oryzae]